MTTKSEKLGAILAELEVVACTRDVVVTGFIVVVVVVVKSLQMSSSTNLFDG